MSQLVDTALRKAEQTVVNDVIAPAVSDVAEELLPDVAAAGAVAVPLATVAVMGYGLLQAAGLVGDSPKVQLWRAQQQAAYWFRPGAVAVVNPYSGETEHFGNYRGPPPVDTGLRNARGGLV